jgi:ATP-dependent Lhr-like helicase
MQSGWDVKALLKLIVMSATYQQSSQFSARDPSNLLLKQARREVLCEQLERHRLEATLQRLQTCRLQLEHTPRPTPLAFPLLAERLTNRMSNESLLQRLQRLRAEAEKAEGLA